MGPFEVLLQVPKTFGSLSNLTKDDNLLPFILQLVSVWDPCGNQRFKKSRFQPSICQHDFFTQPLLFETALTSTEPFLLKTATAFSHTPCFLIAVTSIHSCCFLKQLLLLDTAITSWNSHNFFTQPLPLETAITSSHSPFFFKQLLLSQSPYCFKKPR